MIHNSPGVYVQEYNLSQSIAAVSSSIAAIVGWSLKGPVNEITLVTTKKQFLQKFGLPNAKISFMHHCAIAFLDQGTQLQVVRVANIVSDNTTTPPKLPVLYGGVVVSRASHLNTIQPLSSGIIDPTLYAFASNDLFIITGIDPGSWNNQYYVIVYPNTRINNNTFYVDVFATGQGIALEHHLVSLDYVVDGTGTQLNLVEYINTHSSYIKVIQNLQNTEYSINSAQILVNTLITHPFVGGADGSQPTDSDIINGWNLFADKEQVTINLMINGGYSSVPIQHNLIALAESRMDSVAILDIPTDSQSVQNAIHYRTTSLMADTSYAALYTPDLLITDQYNDIQLYVPPSGHVAAAYAYTDNVAALWFAPAGMKRGSLPVQGVYQVYGQNDRDALDQNEINMCRVIRGAGVKIWGANTLQVMASALSNVNVRRLANFIEQAISVAALYSVFDPNDYILRGFLKELCIRFLQPIEQGRGLYQFDVVCDDTNNPPEVVANGDCVLDVYLDPVLPAKQIHLFVIVNKTGAKVTAIA